jgi:hypothetical protein
MALVEDPVIIKYFDVKTNNIKKIFVVVSYTDKKINDELIKIENKFNRGETINENSILKNKYGSNWKKKLGLIIKSHSVSGGKAEHSDYEHSDFEQSEYEDDPYLFEIAKSISIEGGSINANANANANNANANNANNADEDDIDFNENLIDDLNIRNTNLIDVSIDDLKELDYQEEEKKRAEQRKNADDDFEDDTQARTANTQDNTTNTQTRTAKTADMQARTVRAANKQDNVQPRTQPTKIKFVFDVSLYLMDNIIEFKNKLYLISGIPIYRQHLWYNYNNINHPLSYYINIDNNIKNIDVQNIFDFYSSKNTNDEIENIPIDIKYYRNKSYLQIIAEDSFKIFKLYYDDHNVKEFNIIDLNDIVDTEDLYNKLSKDKYQLDIIYYGFIIKYFPIMTYSVWNTYIKNESNIKDLYPSILQNKDIYRKKLELEKHITDLSYYAYEQTDVNKKIFSSIINTNINIENYKQNYNLLFILRNIFDLLELTETIVYCKANLLYKNSNIILKKAYLNEPEVKLIIPLNSLLIKIKINADENENIKLILYKNGNYMIKTDWREENKMTFNSIIKTVSEKVNPIIKMINKMGPKIKYYDVAIPEINKNNAIFTNTSVVYYFQSDATIKNYRIFTDILLEFNKAEIILNKPEFSQNLEYYFNKGMYDFDSKRIEKIINVDNYYGFLSDSVVKQKWTTIFKNTRLLQIFNNVNNIKIIINGIKNNIEMSIFNIYLNGMIYMYEERIKNLKITTSDTVNSKLTIKNLKLQDPILYDFKKIYNSDVVYSKLCQKQHQPKIISQKEYDKLSKLEKERTIKYWNFTKKEPTWYNCPNTKYPHIKFITNEHPKKYCIPCCMKIPMNENVNPIKQEIHNTCLKTHEFTGEKKNITKKSNYIATYGKNIEIGRLCRLPEQTLEPLFFDTYSDNASIEPECVVNMGYYLIGIDQNLKAVSRVGYIFCLLHSLNFSVDEFFSNCADKIKKDPNKFNVLLDGNIRFYFDTWQELVDTLYLLNSDVLLDSKYDKLDWNKLFMTIGYYYYGVNTLLFHDVYKQNINFVLPKGLTSIDAMFPVHHKNLILLLKNDFYYPIYLINLEIFKKTGIIDTRLFLNESSIITILIAVVRNHFITYDNVKYSIDLSVITKFIEATPQLKLVSYYVNYSNMCYAVSIGRSDKQGDKRSDGQGAKSANSTNLCYFPIEISHYSLNKNINLLFDSDKNKMTNINDLIYIMDLYNKWIKKESYNINEIIRKQTGSKISNDIIYYPEFKISNWLNYNKLTNNPIIGFSSFNLYFYCEGISEKTALSIAKVPIQNLLYNPHHINNIIHDIKKKINKNVSNTEFRKKLNLSLYNYYIYKLLLLHYINIFSKERNIKLRNLIIKTLITNDKNNDKINKIIESITDIEDNLKLKNIVVSYISKNYSKAELIQNINDTKFNFDMLELESIKKMSHKEVFNKLKKISSQFVKFGDIEKVKNFIFPDILSACNDSSKENKFENSYCESAKFIIKESKLNELLLIMASDILNPDKWKWIFNSVFIEKNINYFKFIRRPNESIFIEYR